MTEPPPRATFSDNVNQWVIYDAYQEDFAKQVKQHHLLNDFLMLICCENAFSYLLTYFLLYLRRHFHAHGLITCTGRCLEKVAGVV